jgi:hypothetical protein
MIELLAAAAAATVLQAAPAPSLEDPEAVLVEEVVVTARLPGPAWWKVSDADSTVYILGLPETPLPPGQSWNTSVLQRRLKGAHTYIDAPSVSVNLRGAPAILRLRNRLRSKTPLEEALPPDLKARFVAARQRLGQPASRYSGWTPIVAGERLVSDAEAGDWRQVQNTVRAAAKQAKAPVVSPSTDGRAFINKASASITPAVQRQCMEGALEDVADVQEGRAGAAARAWAEGNVAQAIAAPRSFDRCLLLLAGGPEIWRATSDAQVAAIDKALRRPGHAVAAAKLRRLLARDGVLQGLRAIGYTVTGPAEPQG